MDNVNASSFFISGTGISLVLYLELQSCIWSFIRATCALFYILLSLCLTYMNSQEHTKNPIFAAERSVSDKYAINIVSKKCFRHIPGYMDEKRQSNHAKQSCALNCYKL